MGFIDVVKHALPMKLADGKRHVWPTLASLVYLKDGKTPLADEEGKITADNALQLGGQDAAKYALKTEIPDAYNLPVATSDALGGVKSNEAVTVNGDGTMSVNQLNGKNASEYALNADLAASGAGAHNSIYRGKNLGTSVTAAQYAAIKAGTFDDMYIGDYWVIGGVTYRIAAFDYYYQTGNTACNTHHVTLVPDTNMYTHVMNDTNITTGAYVGSKMYTEGLTQAKETINTAFGSAHVLNHRQYLQNAVTAGYASGGSWYDSTVELMTEQNVYGGKVYGNCENGTALPNSYTVDKSQYPLFAFRPDMISNCAWFWLRDVVSAANFAYVSNSGEANYHNASNARGVRPAFSIIG